MPTLLHYTHLIAPVSAPLTDRCVRRATAGKTAEQDKAIALYLWILSHQFHGMSPQEWSMPGLVFRPPISGTVRSPTPRAQSNKVIPVRLRTWGAGHLRR